MEQGLAKCHVKGVWLKTMIREVHVQAMVVRGRRIGSKEDVYYRKNVDG